MRENCTYGLTRGKMKSGPENVARPFNAYFIFSTLLFKLPRPVATTKEVTGCGGPKTHHPLVIED